MIPPLKLRGSGIADPGTQERGGGGFHSKERDSGGIGGDLKQQEVNYIERGRLLKLTKDDFLAGELWFHQRGVRYQVTCVNICS